MNDKLKFLRAKNFKFRIVSGAFPTLKPSVSSSYTISTIQNDRQERAAKRHRISLVQDLLKDEENHDQERANPLTAEFKNVSVQVKKHIGYMQVLFLSKECRLNILCQIDFTF